MPGYNVPLGHARVAQPPDNRYRRCEISIILDWTKSSFEVQVFTWLACNWAISMERSCFDSDTAKMLAYNCQNLRAFKKFDSLKLAEK